jgi:hypothetical protein
MLQLFCGETYFQHTRPQKAFFTADYATPADESLPCGE